MRRKRKAAAKAPPHKIRLSPHKARGWLVLNGNAVQEKDLIDMVHDCVLRPEHGNPRINHSRKVLLVTAAWERDHEHYDRHIISIFEDLDIDAGWEGILPTNIQNLSVYTMFKEFIVREPWLYRRYTEKQDQIKAIKYDYLVKNGRYVEQIHDDALALEEVYPSLKMYDLYYAEEFKAAPERFCTPEIDGKKNPRFADLKKLVKSTGGYDRARTLRRTIDHLVYKDEEIFGLIRHIEEWFLEKSGVKASSLYQDHREELRQRISSSASIFIFGGRVYVLMNRLRFYRLDEFFHAAVDEGTNVYGISAGALAQTDKFSISFERRSPGGYLRAADYGMGLVHGIWVIPHVTDHQYVREAHRDALTFFAIRQKGGVVVGLSENSLLLCETVRDPVDGEYYKRFTSVGTDPVLVFGQRGELQEMGRNDELFLDGCKFFEGRAQLARAKDVELLEALWRKRWEEEGH